MARSANPVEINNFVAGLITEASPLTFPDGASVSEDNFILNRDGTRKRRLGMDFESGYVDITTTQVILTGDEVGNTMFVWENASGDSSRTLLVVQIGAELKFFDLTVSPLSSALLGTYTFSGTEISTTFSFATVDGILVVTTGKKEVTAFEYDGLVTFTPTEVLLKVRDLFGVQDLDGTTDLRVGSGISNRPSTLTDEHAYNLRNQTWAEPRLTSNDNEDQEDPIYRFEFQTVFLGDPSAYPSNSDSVLPVLYADSSLASNRTAQRFHGEDLYNNPLGTTPAPIGHFIIDAMERGASRQEEIDKLIVRYPTLRPALMPTSLVLDSTPGGPSTVAEFSGHVWFSGFSSSIVDGDSNSPRLGSYVMFSKLVEDITDIARCYQEADPTSRNQSDLVSTDGGFIRIDGAYGIQKLINLGQELVVLATNGVWTIRGGSDFGFSADNYLVRKVTDRGCVSHNSTVVVDNTMMYWADDAIYHIAPNQIGELQAQSITQTTIQTLYNEIPVVDKEHSSGVYDSTSRVIRWLYQNRFDDESEVRELVFDLTLGAFYTSTISDLQTDDIPLVVNAVSGIKYEIVGLIEDVQYNTDNVLYGLEQVQTNFPRNVPLVGSTHYLTITQKFPTINFTFSKYRDEEFTDWKSSNGVGVDAPAHLITGWVSGGDYQRNKQVPYITFHFRRTEGVTVADELGDIYPTNPSSMLVQAQWDWANSANSNRWGRSFQAYRYKRVYMPSGVGDPFDSGFEVVSTKNKLRGKGKVLSLYMQTEPLKDCNLLGWSMVMGASGNV